MNIKPATDGYVESVIDRRPLGRFQLLVIVLCALIAVIDGFDTQAIAFVAPVIAKAWALDVSSFGPVFGAGLLGLTIGALVLGPAADRIGRKPIILLSTTIFAGGSLLTVLASTPNEIMLWRLLTGLGLGGAMPNIIALTSEYAPSQKRSLIVTAMFCGFPIGAVAGGLISTRLIPAFGWQSVFLAGGILPLLLLPALAAWLPESIRFLASRGDTQRAARLLSLIDPSTTIILQQTPATFKRENRQSGRTVLALLSPERAAVSVLLWIAFFCNLLVMYFLMNWLPAVLQQTGLPLERAIIATVILNAGGVVGGLFFSRLADRHDPGVVLSLVYLAAALSVAAIGAGWASTGVTLAVVGVAGFTVIGAQYGMNAFAAAFYPTEMRSTGLGVALGFGRIGSILGPLLGGILLSLRLEPDTLFRLAAIPALFGAVAVFLAGRWRQAPSAIVSSQPSTPDLANS